MKEQYSEGGCSGTFGFKVLGGDSYSFETCNGITLVAWSQPVTKMNISLFLLHVYPVATDPKMFWNLAQIRNNVLGLCIKGYGDV